jgi:hypothetical protein
VYWTSIKNNKLKEENDRINLVVMFQFVLFTFCFNSSRSLSFLFLDKVYCQE